MTDSEKELFNQLAEDESFMEAAKLLDEANNHGTDDEACECGVCSFKSAIDEILMLGDAFDKNAAGDEEWVSPLDFAQEFVSGAQDGIPFVSIINEVIKTLSQLASAASYASWHLESRKAEERGEDPWGHTCDHGEDN